MLPVRNEPAFFYALLHEKTAPWPAPFRKGKNEAKIQIFYIQNFLRPVWCYETDRLIIWIINFNSVNFLSGEKYRIFLFRPLRRIFPLGKGESDMRLRQLVRVNVSRPDGGEETLLKTARTTLRSRLLRRFVGDQYAVLVLTPVGRHVEAVEVRQSKVDD